VENASDWKQTDMMIFQYFIDTFGKEFTFTEDHYDQIKDSTIDFEDMLKHIYNVVSYCKFVD